MALALVGTACGGAGNQNASVTAEDLNSTPLAEFFDTASFSSEEGQQELADQSAKAEAAVAECMRKAGFDYEVTDNFSVTYEEGGYFDDPLDREYVDEFGFGISTKFEDELEQADELGGTSDPNAAIYQELSETEREAYDLALFGSSFNEAVDESEIVEGESDIVVDEGFEFDPAEAGCSGQAFAELDGAFAGEIDQGLDEAFEQLDERIMADPRIVEANADWSSCMAEAGYEYDTVDELYEDVAERMNPIYDAVFGGAEGGEEGAGDGPDEDPGDLSFEAPELSEDAAADLSEIQRFELDVAGANFDCQGPRLAAEVEVRNELEGSFVDQYRSELEAMNP